MPFRDEQNGGENVNDRQSALRLPRSGAGKMALRKESRTKSAVDANGKKVHLPGVDFIKIYTGVNQENGWLGECSTEITGIEDLHVLGINIATRQ